MALPLYTGDTDYVREWANRVTGQADEVRYSMDRFGEEFKAWFNSTFYAALPLEYATLAQLQALVIGEFGEGFVTEAMMAFAVATQAELDAINPANDPFSDF